MLNDLNGNHAKEDGIVTKGYLLVGGTSGIGAEDVARSVLWLLEEAPMVTGQVIAQDGGLSTLKGL
jgi:hypothetical protein